MVCTFSERSEWQTVQNVCKEAYRFFFQNTKIFVNTTFIKNEPFKAFNINALTRTSTNVSSCRGMASLQEEGVPDEDS